MPTAVGLYKEYVLLLVALKTYLWYLTNITAPCEVFMNTHIVVPMVLPIKDGRSKRKFPYF
jgi:hypothetical protein